MEYSNAPIEWKLRFVYIDQIKATSGQRDGSICLMSTLHFIKELFGHVTEAIVVLKGQMCNENSSYFMFY